jgi:hypothetical protein
MLNIILTKVANQWPTAFGKDKIKVFSVVSFGSTLHTLLGTVGRACTCHTEASIVSVLAWRAD